MLDPQQATGEDQQKTLNTASLLNVNTTETNNNDINPMFIQQNGIPPVMGENPNPDDDNQVQGVPRIIPDSQKIPNIAGEKTIVCWNCLCVLMVKDEWTVVRCTNCDKINRVPGTENNLDGMIRLNDNMNHFDVYVPYVYAIITCPFCQHENKVRKDAEHVVCFKCHNSFNLQRDNKWDNPPLGNGANKYPDPSSFQGPKTDKDDHSCNETQRLLRKLIKQLNKKRPVPPPYIPNEKYFAWRQLVRDVDDIDDKRNNRQFKKEYIDKGDYLNMGVFKPKNKSINEQMDELLIKPKNPYWNDYDWKDTDMETLKKRWYAEIKNDPKYRKKQMGREDDYDIMPRRGRGGYPRRDERRGGYEYDYLYLDREKDRGRFNDRFDYGGDYGYKKEWHDNPDKDNKNLTKDNYEKYADNNTKNEKLRTSSAKNDAVYKMMFSQDNIKKDGEIDINKYIGNNMDDNKKNGFNDTNYNKFNNFDRNKSIDYNEIKASIQTNDKQNNKSTTMKPRVNSEWYGGWDFNYDY